MKMVAIATNMTINMIKHVCFFDIMNLAIHVVCTIEEIANPKEINKTSGVQTAQKRKQILNIWLPWQPE